MDVNIIRLAYYLARQNYSLALLGSHAVPAITKHYDGIRYPQPGDLVVETSSFGYRERQQDWHQAIGRFICKRREYVPFKEEPGGYHDDFWYLEALDGKLVRWSNCDFVRVHEDGLPYDDARERPKVDNSAWVAEALIRHELLEKTDANAELFGTTEPLAGGALPDAGQ